MNAVESGRLVIISGPSGAGKSTIVRQLLAKCDLPLQLSVSATTRAPRPGEQDGREYRFLSNEAFDEARRRGAFLECKEVFGCGVWYGTPAESVRQGLADGKWMILEIDIEGAATVLQRDVSPITIFVHPGGMDELERRLRARGTESEAAIARRLEVARGEMEALVRYDHEVINRQVDQAVDEICQILHSYDSAHASHTDSPCIGCDPPL
jgi:guanylate kinase